MSKTILAIVFGFIIVGYLGLPVTADDLITFTPDWIKRVEGYWYGKEISNKEYVTFVDYLIKNQIVPYDYFRILSNKHAEGIITYNNTAVSDEILRIALNEWEKLNPDLAFVESSYMPSLFVREMYYQPFGMETSSDEILLGYVQDGVIYVSPRQNNVTTINMIMHGIGITLGLDQINDDESHLMYESHATKSKSSFDDKSYTIPEIFTRAKLNSYLGNAESGILYDGILTYKFDPIPDKIKQKTFIKEAVANGFKLWSKENPKLVFSEIFVGEPDIQISWIDFRGTHTGMACLDCLQYGATIEIALAQLDCRNELVQYDSGMITNIVAHEFGHNLGLEHNADENHLMWSNVDPQIPYDSLGYNIPKLVPESFLGYDKVFAKYDSLSEELKEIGKELDRLNALYEIRGSPSVYHDIVMITDNYNKKVEEINQLVWDIDCVFGDNVTYYDDGSYSVKLTWRS